MKLAIILLLFITSCLAFDDRECTCLARGIYFEAGNQSYQGKLAVANVIKNRKENWNIKTYCSVVNQPGQFLWKNTKIPKKGTPNYKNWKYSNNLAKYFLNHPNRFADNTNGSLFFHAKYVNPKWDLKRTVIIDDHIFYK